MLAYASKISNGEKPRILIFSVAYEPLVGGAEIAVRNITDRLSSYEFDLVTCRFGRSHKPMEQIGNVRVFRVGFGSRLGRYLYPVFAYRLASKLHKKNPYQVVWSIMAAYAGAAALMFLRRHPSVKFLLTLQEGDSIEHIHKQVRGFRRQWGRIFQKADYIQTISNYLAIWAKKEGAKGLVEVVPNGVDISKFKDKNSKIKIADQNSKVIITTSRLVPKNGIDILIRAAKELKSSMRDIGCLVRIVGSGPEENKLKELAQDLNVSDKVDFVGGVVPEKIPDYLADAYIFVRVARSEGLGNSFLEAMAAGLPVIGTAVGGIPDFLKDGETGLFCKTDDPQDLAEKIRLLFENEQLRNKLAENGRKLVEEKYDWGIVAREMDRIFKLLAPN